jgi:hypothetical protein
VSEGSAEGGSAPLSDGQFGDVTETGDNPQTAQNPGNGIFAFGFYPWSVSQRPRNRKKRKRSR